MDFVEFVEFICTVVPLGYVIVTALKMLSESPSSGGNGGGIPPHLYGAFFGKKK